MVVIKEELQDGISIYNADHLTKHQSRENTNSREVIVCKICMSYFADWISLEHHLENCYRHVCGICGQIFASDDKLIEHTLTHEVPDKTVKLIQRARAESHTCRFCKKSYKFSAELRYHLLAHTAVKHYLCSYCGNKFSLTNRSKCERTYTQHSRAHINKKSGNKAREFLKPKPRFGCAICKKLFRRKKSLRIRTRKKLSPSRSSLYIRTIKKAFLCLYCRKHFATQCDQLLLKRNHNDEKPYKCTDCNKCFSGPRNLRRHIYNKNVEKDSRKMLNGSHSEEKPFMCSHCSKCFTYEYRLVTHERIHTGEKPFACSDCSKTFITQSNLNTHKRVHTGEKPYECLDCGKCFTQSSALKSHTRTHTGEKPYECSQCSKRFTTLDAFTKHTRTHTGEQPYGCSDCSKRFSQLSSLNLHRKSIHIAISV